MIVYWHPATTDLATIFLYGQHRRLRQTHGSSIIRAFEQVTGVSFRSGVRITVAGGWSHEDSRFGSTAGFDGRKAICLRYASRTPSESQVLAEMTHELGHRLLEQHTVPNATGLDDQWIFESHRQLFVFLIDVVCIAFDHHLATRILSEIESGYSEQGRSDQAPYVRSWRWALNCSRKRRREITRLMFTGKLSTLPRK
jgi:hypothetical protein